MRTGGLEAAIALHAVNNLVVLIGAAATDEIDSSLTATDVSAGMALFDIAVLGVSGYLLARNARRLGATTHTDPAAA
jgi:membrane protease YdiL (CAAX protease family)